MTTPSATTNPNTTTTADPATPPVLTTYDGSDGLPEAFALVAAVFVAVLGFATSFEAVSVKMRPDFGNLAWLVPLGTDVGILTSSAAYIVLARRDEAPGWLRFVPHSLAAA